MSKCKRSRYPDRAVMAYLFKITSNYRFSWGPCLQSLPCRLQPPKFMAWRTNGMIIGPLELSKTVNKLSEIITKHLRMYKQGVKTLARDFCIK